MFNSAPSTDDTIGNGSNPSKINLHRNVEQRGDKMHTHPYTIKQKPGQIAKDRVSAGWQYHGTANPPPIHTNRLGSAKKGQLDANGWRTTNPVPLFPHSPLQTVDNKPHSLLLLLLLLIMIMVHALLCNTNHSKGKKDIFLTRHSIY